jgi:hypothetical protein
LAAAELRNTIGIFRWYTLAGKVITSRLVVFIRDGCVHIDITLEKLLRSHMFVPMWFR